MFEVTRVIVALYVGDNNFVGYFEDIKEATKALRKHTQNVEHFIKPIPVMRVTDDV